MGASNKDMRILWTTIAWEICTIAILAIVLFSNWAALPAPLSVGFTCIGLFSTIFGIFLVLRLMQYLGFT